MSIKKQPYEISLWNDIQQPGTDDYAPYLDEEKFAIIGSDTMTAPYRAHSPQFTKNMNGTLKLTFTMYLRYYNEETGTYDTNPYSKLMVNEAKIKLKRREKGEDKWYDLVIKNIQESSDKNSMIYTCESQAISELSKTGFNLEFKNDLLNNIDTLPGFTKRVLAETDWKLEKVKLLQDKREEPVVKMKITGNFKAHNMEKNEQLQNVYIDSNNGETCYFYCSYSSFSNEADRVFFLYRVKQDYKSDKSTRVLTNASCFFIEDASWTETEENGEKKLALIYQNQTIAKEIGVSSEFRGKFYVRNQKSVHEPITDKIVNVYTDKNGKTVYGYTDTTYIEPALAKNLITNGVNFTLDAQQGTVGWSSEENVSNVVITNGFRSSSSSNAKFLHQSEDETKSVVAEAGMYPYLTMEFYNNSFIINSGIGDHLQDIETEGFKKGAEYVFRIDFQESNCPMGSLLTGPNTEDVDKIVISDSEAARGPRLVLAKLTRQKDEHNVESLVIASDDDIYFETRGMKWTTEVGVNEETGKTEYKSTKYIKTSFKKAISYSELLKNSDQYQLVFFNNTGVSNPAYYIINKIQFFKYEVDALGNMVVPDEFSTGTDSNKLAVTESKYFYGPSDSKLIIKPEDIEYYQEKDIEGLKPIYDTNYEKQRSIDIAESNRFNIIQSLCEKFETWVDFRIDHDSNGKIKIEDIKDSTGKIIEKRQAKYVTFFDYINEDIKYPGFKYGINLNSIQRTIASDQIVSKIIVKNNSNSLAKNGICTIARAKDNPTGENFFYDFSYYINQEMIPYETVIEDLYGKGKYYETYKSYNKQQQVLAEEMSELLVIIAKLESQKTIVKELLKATQNEISDTSDSIEAITGKKGEYSESNDLEIAWNVFGLTITVILLVLLYSAQDSVFKNYENLVNDRRTEYKNKQEAFDVLTEKKEALNKKFYSKYSRFIQEGSWVSNDYVDDNLYYYDAQNVLSASTQPKVSYSLSVIDVSPLDGYEAYSYDIGDHTYVEDTEFFGWLSTEENGRIINTPYREEVIVSEITDDLDSPENNKITIQNYKTNFQDLFQRITATTQSLQFAKGDYNRAANTINPDGTFDADYFQNTLLSKAFTVLNPENESIKWDANGIQVIDKRNPNNIIKLSSGMISISDTGGKDWTTAISAKGVNTGILTNGVINTEKVYIGNEKNFSFRWDSVGLNAYKKKTDDTYNYGKFVRFDRFGLYGYSKGEVFVPKKISDIENNADFGLTWNGFFLKSEHPETGGGSVKISKGDDFQVFGPVRYKNDDGVIGTKIAERLKIGYLGTITDENEQTKYLYGIRLNNDEGDETVTVDSIGNIKIKGTIDAIDGKIGGWTIKDNTLTTVVKEDGIFLDGENSQIYSNEWLKSDRGNGWCITNTNATFNNITLRGSLKCAILEYGEIQAVGGIVLIRPSTTVKKIGWHEASDIGAGTGGSPYALVEDSTQFKRGDFCQFCFGIPDDEEFSPVSGEETVINSGINNFVYEITGFNSKNHKIIYFNKMSREPNDPYSYSNLRKAFDKSSDTIGLVSLGVPQPRDKNEEQASIALGLNSSDNNVIVPKKSFSVLTLQKYTKDGTNWLYYRPRIILGKIPKDETTKIFADEIRGKYGLYADAVQLRGNITATSGYIGNEDGGWKITNNRLVCQSTQTNSDGTVIGYYETGFSTKWGTDYAMWSGSVERTHYDNKNDETPNAKYRESMSFRVGHDGTLWATRGYIGNWVIASTEIKNKDNRNCLYYKTFSQPEILLHPTGTIGNFDPTNYKTGFKAGSSNNQDGWVFLAGNIKNESGGSTLGYKFGVTKEGIVWAKDAQISGTITANTGHIGSWEISDYKLVGYNINKDSICVGLCSTPGQSFPAFWAGGTGKYVSQSNYNAKFWVTHDGDLTANNATIKGKIITSDDSNQTLVGNWRITSNGVLVGTRKISENSNQQTFLLNPNSSYSRTAIAIGTPSNNSNVDGTKAVFFVDHEGHMRADSAEIIGNITANSGTIGSWAISTLSKTSVGVLHSTTGRIDSSTGKLLAPDVLLCALGTKNSLTDGNGYYVKSESYSGRNGWIFLAKRANDTSYAYNFGIKSNGMLYTTAGAKIGNWSIDGDGCFSCPLDISNPDDTDQQFYINPNGKNGIYFQVGRLISIESSSNNTFITNLGGITNIGTCFHFSGQELIVTDAEGNTNESNKSNYLEITKDSLKMINRVVISKISNSSLESEGGQILIHGRAIGNDGNISGWTNGGVRIIGLQGSGNGRLGTISFYNDGNDPASSGQAKIMYTCPNSSAATKQLVLASKNIVLYGNYNENADGAASLIIRGSVGFLNAQWVAENFTYTSPSANSISSDRNVKNSISYLSNEYSTLFDNLIPVTYKYSDGQSNRTHTGFIAQDVESAIYNANLTTQDFAAFVKNESGEYFLRYEEFIALNTSEIQKLKRRILALENKIKELSL